MVNKLKAAPADSARAFSAAPSLNNNSSSQWVSVASVQPRSRSLHLVNSNRQPVSEDRKAVVSLVSRANPRKGSTSPLHLPKVSVLALVVPCSVVLLVVPEASANHSNLLRALAYSAPSLRPNLKVLLDNHKLPARLGANSKLSPQAYLAAQTKEVSAKLNLLDRAQDSANPNNQLLGSLASLHRKPSSAPLVARLAAVEVSLTSNNSSSPSRQEWEGDFSARNLKPQLHRHLAASSNLP